MTTPTHYRFGNEFAVLLVTNTTPVTSLPETTVKFVRERKNKVHALKKNHLIIMPFEKFKQGARLSGITAEYLAELAIKNSSMIEFENYKKGDGVIEWSTETARGGRLKREDETPSQFFLRVAVDHGYIAKEITNLK